MEVDPVQESGGEGGTLFWESGGFDIFWERVRDRPYFRGVRGNDPILGERSRGVGVDVIRLYQLRTHLPVFEEVGMGG